MSIHNYYYNEVRNSLLSYVQMATSRLSEYSEKSATEFETAAQNYINNYSNRNRAEAQILASDDRIIASSRGVIQDYSMVDTKVKTTEQNNAVEAIGYSGDQKLMVYTSQMKNDSGKVFGSVRFAVSLKRLDRQILVNTVLIIGVGIILVFFVFLLGVYFLRSIIIPVKNITHAAQNIASGRFDERIHHKNESEEIATLCDSINFMASELSHADSIKNEFISSVSHELRTPLTAIKGWGETIQASGVSDPIVLEKGMNIILKETERMEGLVEDLLDFSRIESGRLKVNLQKCDLLAELEEAVYMYGEVAGKLGININFNPPEFLPPVLADANRIRQVFINIIDNAIKYSSAGGTVTITAEECDVLIKITVRDMGCGIKKEDLPRVKEKFYKANQTVRGSGIGLAVADEIVRQHNGFLEIDSVEGYGTTVEISIPFITAQTNEGD